MCSCRGLSVSGSMCLSAIAYLVQTGNLQVVCLVVFYHLVKVVPSLHKAVISPIDGCPGNRERKDLASMGERNVPDLLEGRQDLFALYIVCYVTVKLSQTELRKREITARRKGPTSLRLIRRSNRKAPGHLRLQHNVSPSPSLDHYQLQASLQCFCIRSWNVPLVTRSPGTPSTTVSIWVSGMMVPSILTTSCENGWYTAPMEEYPATSDAPRNSIRIFLGAILSLRMNGNELLLGLRCGPRKKGEKLT